MLYLLIESLFQPVQVYHKKKKNLGFISYEPNIAMNLF